MDEEAVKPQGEETPTTDSPPVEEQTPETTEEVKAPEQEEAQEAPVEEEPAPEPVAEEKPKAKNRFQELANQVREVNEQLEREKAEKAKLLEQLTPAQEKAVQFDPNREYTVEEYNAMLREAQQMGAAQANMSVEQLRQEIAAKEQRQKFETSFQSDITYLENTYPELNQESDQYNSVLHREVTEAYQELAVEGETLNPNISLRKIGDRIMRSAKELAKSAQAQATKEVAQAASASVQADATQKKSTEIGPEWFRTEYNPNNPEHRRIADDYVAKNQFKS